MSSGRVYGDTIQLGIVVSRNSSAEGLLCIRTASFLLKNFTSKIKKERIIPHTLSIERILEQILYRQKTIPFLRLVYIHNVEKMGGGQIKYALCQIAGNTLLSFQQNRTSKFILFTSLFYLFCLNRTEFRCQKRFNKQISHENIQNLTLSNTLKQFQVKTMETKDTQEVFHKVDK